jgi:hypothetical protein
MGEKYVKKLPHRGDTAHVPADEHGVVATEDQQAYVLRHFTTVPSWGWTGACASRSSYMRIWRQVLTRVRRATFVGRARVGWVFGRRCVSLMHGSRSLDPRGHQTKPYVASSSSAAAGSAAAAAPSFACRTLFVRSPPLRGLPAIHGWGPDPLRRAAVGAWWSANSSWPDSHRRPEKSSPPQS